jgi:hypothetical protein
MFRRHEDTTASSTKLMEAIRAELRHGRLESHPTSGHGGHDDQRGENDAFYKMTGFHKAKAEPVPCERH